MLRYKSVYNASVELAPGQQGQPCIGVLGKLAEVKGFLLPEEGTSVGSKYTSSVELIIR